MSVNDKNASFTDAEKAAMKERAEELRSSGRGGVKKVDLIVFYGPIRHDRGTSHFGAAWRLASGQATNRWLR